MFDVLGVIDLRGGLAVRARGGRRDQYAPIEHVAGTVVRSGDAEDLAREYVDQFGLTQLYVADLDAIEGERAQAELVQRIASTSGASVWLDAGIASVSDAQRALDHGATRLIVGLETLPSFQTLESIVKSVGRDAVVFSLDLRDGKPVARASDLATQPPHDLLMQAVAAGAVAAIVLDLARVGAGSGLDLELLARLRAATSIELYVGGGVRDANDLEQVRRAGCNGALVASALLDGALVVGG